MPENRPAAPDYADKIAAELIAASYLPTNYDALEALLAKAAREGYAMGLAVNA